MSRGRPLSQWVSRLRDFTLLPWFLLELSIVAVIVAILMRTALEQYHGVLQRAEVAHILQFFHSARSPVEYYWNLYGRFPDTLGEALDEHTMRTFSEMLLGEAPEHDPTEHADVSYAPSGAITFEFISSRADLTGRKLTFRPAIMGTGDAQRILWLCGNERPPENALVLGENHTNLPPAALGGQCGNQPFETSPQ